MALLKEASHADSAAGGLGIGGDPAVGGVVIGADWVFGGRM